MRHRKQGRRLNRSSAHRRALLSNLVASLLKHEQIRTTLPKARELRPVAEKIITLGKRGGLHARRQALAFLGDRKIVDKLFTTLSKRYADRSGGYARVIKAGYRYGDAAPMALIELVDRDVDAKGEDSGPPQNVDEDEEEQASAA